LEEALRHFTTLRDLPLRDIVVHVVDILLVAYLIYRLLLLVRGTRAWRILMGIIFFLGMLWLSDALQLNTLHWILDRATLLAPVALVILFLPELRQAVEGIGKLGLWPKFGSGFGVGAEERAEARTVEEIVAAVAELAAASTGALIVVEKGTPLTEIASNGVQLDAKVSAPLLISIFFEKNPLHDGAVIVRGDTIVSAACRLPLSESQRLDQHVHMRHRAAVGVTEALDCIAIVVSEERGTISFANEGRLKRLPSHLELREMLNAHLRDDGRKGEAPRERRPKGRNKEGVKR
jgi:diadenylate cyclase